MLTWTLNPSLICVMLTGSSHIAELAALARPRYHFAGSKNTFYARPPYLNADLGAGSHVTRFIGLACVGNVAKQKSLHALGLTPAAQMDLEALQQKPEVSCLVTSDPASLQTEFVSQGIKDVSIFVDSHDRFVVSLQSPSRFPAAELHCYRSPW